MVSVTTFGASKVQDHILTTAIALFYKEGYFKTSIHDIVRESGVSIGSIYHHFKNKEGIVLALYHTILAGMAEELQQIITSEPDVANCCKRILKMLFLETEQHPEVMGFILHARHREFLPDEAPICSSRPFEMMRSVVARGMEENVIRKMDPMVAAACLFGGPIRMIHLRLDGVLPTPLPDYLEEVWDCAWSAVTG